MTRVPFDMIPDPHRLQRRLTAALLAAALSSLASIAAARDAGGAQTAEPGPIQPEGAASTSRPAPAPLPGEAGAVPETGRLLGPVRAHLASGNVTAARVACRLLMREHPNNPEVLVQMADIDLLLRNGGPAEVVLERAIANGMPRERVLTRLGESYLLQGQPQRVLDALKPPGSDPALAADVLALQARALLILGQGPAGTKLLDKALAFDPDNLAALTARGIFASTAGDLEAARAAFDRAIAAHADAHEALAMRGETLLLEGRPVEAEAGYTAALEAAPSQWLYRFNRALVRIDLGRLDDAEQDLEQVQTAFPDFVGLGLGRGKLALARGEPEAALDALEGYLSRIPGDTQAFGLAMQAAARSGELTRLRELAGRAQRLSPGSPGPALITGEALLRSGNAAGALEALEPVQGLARTNPTVALLLIQTLREAQRADQADRALAEALALFPEDAGLALEDARRLAAEGASSEALARIDTVLAARPDNAAARVLRARLLLERKRPAEALAEGRALVDAAPSAAYGYRVLAAARLGQGEREGARAALAQALERTTALADIAVVAVELAMLDIEAGDLDAGLRHLRQALEADPGNTRAMAALARWDPAADGLDLRDRLRGALEADPRDASVRAALIGALLGDGDTSTAEQVADDTPIEQAQDGPPDLAQARAVAYLNAGRPDEALGLLAVLSAAGHGGAQTDYLSARAHAAKADRRAREAFLKGWGRDPDTPLAGPVLNAVLGVLEENSQRAALAQDMERAQPGKRLTALLEARIASDRGDRAGAVERWRALYAEEPEAAANFGGYLEALLAAGQFDEAQRITRRWNEAHPEAWEADRAIANAFARGGRLADAAPHYQRVLERSPNDPFALNNLALHLMASDPETALAYAEQALALYPDEVQIMDTTGTARLAAGDALGAADILRRAHEVAPAEPSFAFHLAQALDASGDSAGALDVLRPIVSLEFEQGPAARALLGRLEAGGR